METRPARNELPSLSELSLRETFPEQPAEFVHGLHQDDRLTLAAVADLADRLSRESVICDTAAQPLLVPQGGPPRGALSRPGDVIRLEARALDKFIKRERLFVVHDNVFFNQHGEVICSGRGWTIRPQ